MLRRLSCNLLCLTGHFCLWRRACCSVRLPFACQAFKHKGEAYKVMWPGKAEFVRMAAKFGATIVPFAAIGCDEGVVHHLSPEELQQLNKLLPQLPFKLPWQQQRESDAERLRRIPAARVGVNATMEDIEAFTTVSAAVAVPGVCMLLP